MKSTLRPRNGPPPMSPPRPDSRRRAARWLVPAAALVVAPKCFVCVAGYLGLGAWFGAKLGAGAREICGAPGVSPIATATTWVVLLGAGLGILVLRRR